MAGLMTARNGHATRILAASTLDLCLWIQATTAQEAPPVTPGPDGIIVAFGEEDHRYEDFARSGYEGVHKYECVVGVDCDTASFPDAIYDLAQMPSPYYERSAVAEARIRCNLMDDTDGVTLRLARGGSETAVVQVDDRPRIELPPDMFDPPTKDGGGYGVYDLRLGTLDRGDHVIRLMMKSGTGNGAFGWDAVILGVGAFDD